MCCFFIFFCPPPKKKPKYIFWPWVSLSWLQNWSGYALSGYGQSLNHQRFWGVFEGSNALQAIQLWLSFSSSTKLSFGVRCAGCAAKLCKIKKDIYILLWQQKEGKLCHITSTYWSCHCHAIQLFINKSNLTFYPACPPSACPKTHSFNQVKHGETVTPTRPCPGLLVEANRGRAFSAAGGEGNEVAATVMIGMLHVDIFFSKVFR